MRRRLLNVLIALSLLVCAAGAAFSYSGEIYYLGHQPRWSFAGEQGTIVVHRGFEGRWEAKVRWVLVAGLALPAGGATSDLFRRLMRNSAARRLSRGLCPR